MSEVFTPLGVKISLPSLRITETLKKIPALLAEGRRSGLTLAPEVARDDMREQIRKPINNQDLYDGCAEAFRRGWRKVKLYFMCGLPGERTADLDGIVDDGRDHRPDRQGGHRPLRRGHRQRVELHPQAAHAPTSGTACKCREYLHWAHRYLKSQGQAPLGDGEVPRHRAEHARGDLDPRRPPGRGRARGRLVAAAPGSTPGASTSTPGSGGTPSPSSASTSPSTATASGRSRRSSPGTTSTSSSAASTWPRSRPARSRSSRRWRGRCERSRIPDSRSTGRSPVGDVAELNMATASQTKLMTAEEFMAADLGEGTFELVRGEVIEVPPPMPEHGRSLCQCRGFFWRLRPPDRVWICALERLGRASPSAGPTRCEAPMSAFTAMPAGHGRRSATPCRRCRRMWPSKCISPSNRRGAMKKVSEYLERGHSWSGSSIRQTGVRSPSIAPMTNAPLVLREGDFIENLPELPGFRCAVADFFV